MILTEQMYKNLYRPYYHGQRYLETSCFTALLGAPHACTFGSFPICIQRLKSLEKEYKEWDFSKVNFSQTDTEKMNLNIAIKKYNDNSLKLMDYKLYDVFEAQRIAKEEADEAIK